jgi:hypothetical protein
MLALRCSKEAKMPLWDYKSDQIDFPVAGKRAGKNNNKSKERPGQADSCFPWCREERRESGNITRMKVGT